MLRNWQIECTDLALDKYKSNKNHFFCQATPGAGKTVLAATIAFRLLAEEMVDLILCFSPSLTVSDGIKQTFSRTLNCTFNGGLGSIGQSLTYQSIQYIHDDFWHTLQNHKVFVVFDEIHHCSGSEIKQGNAWGQQVLTKIQKLATFTLAMSGTPWRSDSLPIVLSEYRNPEGKLIVDYQYTLKQAIADNVCRTPKVVLVDNEHLSITNDKKIESFSSILEMLEQTKTSYRSVIHNQEAIEYLLDIACKKLTRIRSQSPNAGGLVVASSVQHAQTIKNILCQKYNQTVSIVTYRHEDPLTEIDCYRKNNNQWIVSVGMISEGTDIPRLQVCCHMSSVKTELYFRQVLGRILRVNDDPNQIAWLFTFAEQNLIEFSERIERDIPNTCSLTKMNEELKYNQHEKKDRLNDSDLMQIENSDNISLEWNSTATNNCDLSCTKPSFSKIELGTFKQRVISAFMTGY